MHTNSQTLIVILPFYNSEATLAAAVESILGQSYRNLRLIMINDCSTDRSLAIAQGYLKDERVTVVSNSKNRGAYYSRNVGLHLVKDLTWGYFTTHDSDDISFKHRYITLIQSLKKHTNAVAVQDRFQRVDLYTNKIIREHVTFAHALFARSIFEGVGYFDNSRFGADWDHWERALAFSKKRGWHHQTVDALMGISFVHENNLTVKIPGRSAARRNYVARSRQKHKRMLAVSNWYQEFQFFSKELIS
jgi:glycosyltransferase involved in cell wall biosynthesis